MLALLALSALAADTWSEPHPGISLLERTTTTQHITAAYVDVCADGMHARATTHAERRQRTSAWAESVDALVAVNGAFFSYGDYHAIGWSVGAGQTWPGASDVAHYTAVAFASHGRSEIFLPEDTLPPAGEDWWREAVPGDPLLVLDGTVVEEECYSHMCERHPRTAVGLVGEHQVVLVAVDGRSTLAQVERDTGVPATTIIQALGLPATVSRHERLGRLRKIYGFSMHRLRQLLDRQLAGQH